MKILIDMNLSPDWVGAFAANEIESVHWSTVGDPQAEDDEIMAYARQKDYIVFTHDLDFGTIGFDAGVKPECRPSSLTKYSARSSCEHCHSGFTK